MEIHNLHQWSHFPLLTRFPNFLNFKLMREYPYLRKFFSKIDLIIDLVIRLFVSEIALYNICGLYRSFYFFTQKVPLNQIGFQNQSIPTAMLVVDTKYVLDSPDQSGGCLLISLIKLKIPFFLSFRSR